MYCIVLFLFAFFVIAIHAQRNYLSDNGDGDNDSGDEDIGSQGCFPDIRISNSYYNIQSIYTDQVASVQLSQTGYWNPGLCQVKSIPIDLKVSVGIYNIQFNESLSLPVDSNTNSISNSFSISLPINPTSIVQNENLPGYLFVREINSGNGFKSPSSTEGKVCVAQVFERPRIYPSDVKIYRTQTLQLHISGEGFTDRFSKMRLTVGSLVEGTDYTITVLNREELVVTLLDGRRCI